jgi:hypothetical protein
LDPLPADLIDLRHPQCQGPAQVTTTYGAKVSCMCGQSMEDCKCLSRHHISGCYDNPVNAYIQMTDVCLGY